MVNWRIYSNSLLKPQAVIVCTTKIPNLGSNSCWWSRRNPHIHMQAMQLRFRCIVMLQGEESLDLQNNSM